MDAEKKALAADGESRVEMEKKEEQVQLVSLKNILWVYSVHSFYIHFLSLRTLHTEGTILMMQAVVKGYTTCTQNDTVSDLGYNRLKKK